MSLPKAVSPTLYDQTLEEIRQVYLADARPWVIGFSGGKDSTVALQLVWYALLGLKPSERQKPVYVISGDTLVETPAIIDYLTQALALINRHADADGLPLSAHKVTPTPEETFLGQPGREGATSSTHESVPLVHCPDENQSCEPLHLRPSS